jgi:hypothetical protein
MSWELSGRTSHIIVIMHNYRKICRHELGRVRVTDLDTGQESTWLCVRSMFRGERHGQLRSRNSATLHSQQQGANSASQAAMLSRNLEAIFTSHLSNKKTTIWTLPQNPLWISSPCPNTRDLEIWLDGESPGLSPQSPDGDSPGQPQDPQLPRDTRKLSRLRYEAITSSSCAITFSEREFWRI